jgi:hypothetical protein
VSVKVASLIRPAPLNECMRTSFIIHSNGPKGRVTGAIWVVDIAYPVPATGLQAPWADEVELPLATMLHSLQQHSRYGEAERIGGGSDFESSVRAF